MNVRRILAAHTAGDTINVVIVDNGNQKTLPVSLKTRLYHPPLGIVFARNAEEMNALQYDSGAVIWRVQNGSPAEQAGLATLLATPTDLTVGVHQA